MAYIGPVLFLITTYLIAAVPFGLVIAKIFSTKDIRQHGSKNIGATNVTRVLGKKLGFLTLILDLAKGAVMVTLAKFIFSQANNLNVILALVALIAVIGHIFPIYLKFKGGKGVATTIAVILALNPKVGLVVVLTWLLTFFIFRISAISSLAAIFFANLFAIYDKVALEQLILYFLLLILITLRHKENIIRIKNGRENKV